jgi:DNA-binding NtrC family response regulator
VSEPRGKLLLVDDDDSLRRVAEYQLADAGFAVTACGSAEEALEAVRGDGFELVVSDLLMPGMSGIELLERVRVLRPECAVVIITAHGDVSSAVRAMQLGAVDFIEKPFSGERLVVSVRRALEYVRLRDENQRLRALVQEHGAFEDILGSSRALKATLADLELAAATDATVLIFGESGTGKELAARAIHANSRRRGGAFVVVNCAAIPENLIESELFGHRKGAFTGATEERKGKFELASGGTLLLDEVAELPLALQPRLLRALQEGEVDKVGAGRPVKVDVRVIAATNRDLERMVRNGAFREDLWYRLDVVPLRMPPLRERKEDIALLAEHFLLKHARRHGRPIPRLEPEAVARLEAYAWPGNVRELENAMERLVVLARADTVGVADLPEPVRDDASVFGGVRVQLPDEGIVLDEVERDLIVEALRRCKGNQSAASRFLGISRQTLIYRLQKYGLT